MMENYLSRRRVLGLGAGLGAATVLSLAGCGGDDDGGPAASGDGGKTYTGPKVDLNLWNGFTGGDGDIGFTCGSMISALTPGAVESWMSPGPPNEAGYTRLSFAPDPVPAA